MEKTGYMGAVLVLWPLGGGIAPSLGVLVNSRSTGTLTPIASRCTVVATT